MEAPPLETKHPVAMWQMSPVYLRSSSLYIKTDSQHVGTHPHRFIQALSKIIWNAPDTFHCGEKKTKIRTCLTGRV